MKTQILLPILPLFAGAVSAAKELVTPKALVKDTDVKELARGSARLQHFAYSYWQKDRVFGGEAHNDTVTFIYNKLKATGAYDVYLQPQRHPWSASNQTLKVTGDDVEIGGATYGPNGDVTAPLTKVNNLGCSADDFPAAVKGNIALIERGTCTFSDKVALSGAAGAVGAIIYNNVPGSIAGTLGTPTNPLGPYVPVVFASQEDGQSFVKRLEDGEELVSNLYVHAVTENRLTYNVIAETKSGNHNKVVALGGHTDSVNGGPGINDDGSGSIGILHVAENLAKYKVTNAVRFCFWTAEEFGLLGSTYYVDSLSRRELNKIALYLNFDMIASPNYVYGIYDGDGSAFNLTGPPGSSQIEALFQKFYRARNTPSMATAFSGRSDYQAFINHGIPAGGLFTGAEETKTVKQAKRFGGTAGEALDPCYHAACDTTATLAMDAFELNTQGIAYSVATYATDLSSIPQRDANAPNPMTAARVATSETGEKEEYITMHCSKHKRFAE